MRDFCDEMEELVLGNEIFQARTREIGVIPPEVAYRTVYLEQTSEPQGLIGTFGEMPM